MTVTQVFIVVAILFGSALHASSETSVLLLDENAAKTVSLTSINTKIADKNITTKMIKAWYDKKSINTIIRLSRRALELKKKWILPESYISNVDFTWKIWEISQSTYEIVKVAFRYPEEKPRLDNKKYWFTSNDFDDDKWLKAEVFDWLSQAKKEALVKDALISTYWEEAYNMPELEKRTYLMQYINSWFLLTEQSFEEITWWETKLSIENFKKVVEALFDDVDFESWKREAYTNKEYDDKKMKKEKRINELTKKRWLRKDINSPEIETLINKFNSYLEAWLVLENREIFRKIFTAAWWLAYIENLEDESKKQKLSSLVSDNVNTISAFTDPNTSKIKTMSWRLKYIFWHRDDLENAGLFTDYEIANASQISDKYIKRAKTKLERAEKSHQIQIEIDESKQRTAKIDNEIAESQQRTAESQQRTAELDRQIDIIDTILNSNLAKLAKSETELAKKLSIIKESSKELNSKLISYINAYLEGDKEIKWKIKDLAKKISEMKKMLVNIDLENKEKSDAIAYLSSALEKYNKYFSKDQKK